jgi:drug/metabolite transporter (DMT)-like permease
VIIHVFYQVFLIYSYRSGDLSHIYPVARGSSPAVVAIVAAVIAGELVSTRIATGIALVTTGVLVIGIHGLLQKNTSNRSIVLALVTGASIAAYTVVDGLGARASQDALSFIAYLYVLEVPPMLLFGVAMNRGNLMASIKTNWKKGVLGGIFASVAYGIVIWAMSLNYMAQVSALRETSVVFAALIGTIFLGEPFGKIRLLGALIITAGILLLKT